MGPTNPAVDTTPSDPPAQLLELCVHGVSGTPPEDILHCAPQELEITSGDGRAGFYRRRGQAGQQREVFSWGGLTSGPATRALFVLFLPFALINLAHWMLPPVQHRWWGSCSVRVLRVLGLTLTLTLLLSTAAVVLDVIAWQCAAYLQCRALHWGLSPLFDDLSASQRLAVGAVCRLP